MKAKFSRVLVLTLLILSLICVSSRPFASNKGTYKNLKSLQRDMGKVAKEMRSSKIGSIPPKCEHKCFGCSPCEPIQVPTTSSRVHVQYTNYEPEGWKCKCGPRPTLYAP